MLPARPILLLIFFTTLSGTVGAVTVTEEHQAVLARSCATDKPAGFDRNGDSYRAVVREVIQRGENTRLAKLREAKSRAKRPGTRRPAIDRKKWKATVSELEECRGFYVPQLTSSGNAVLSTGLVGTMRFTVTILQVTGPDTMIVTRGKQRVWFKGFSTKGFADDDRLRISRIVWVTGTHQYTAVSGAVQTVMKIEPFPLDWRTWRELAVEEGLIEDPDKAEPEKLRRNVWRTWTAGKHTTVARFGGTIGQAVRLKKKDGTTVSVPLEKLSEADRKWIKSRK